MVQGIGFVEERIVKASALQKLRCKYTKICGCVILLSSIRSLGMISVRPEPHLLQDPVFESDNSRYSRERC